MTPLRAGPRPLALHLAAAGAISASSLLAWPLLRSGWRPWRTTPPRDAEKILQSLASADPEGFAAAVTAELAQRHDEFLTGVEAYRSHPWRREIAPPPPVWEAGAAQLLDYGIYAPDGAGGQPVLVVPSLVNRAYILDLLPERSLMRFLAGRGFRPLLLDWGTPGKAELAMDLDETIGGTMRAALAAANECARGAPVPLVGYCMGGTMATALAALEPDRVAALGLLAAPWDFHAATGGPPPMVALGRTTLEGILTTMGCLPVDVLQALFFSLDPALGWAKFRRFAHLDRNGPHARAFVALEDWLNDGVPLAGPIAHECLFGWYRENAPARGAWSVCGTLVDPGRIRLPAFAAIPANDRIVPPASAAALADRLPRAEVISPQSGHIGMTIGGTAPATLWTPLADWLESCLKMHRKRRKSSH